MEYTQLNIVLTLFSRIYNILTQLKRGNCYLFAFCSVMGLTGPDLPLGIYLPVSIMHPKSGISHITKRSVEITNIKGAPAPLGTPKRLSRNKGCIYVWIIFVKKFSNSFDDVIPYQNTTRMRMMPLFCFE